MKLIFLNPDVLTTHPMAIVPTPHMPFDPNACLAFKDLMNRVDDVAIVILATYSPTLDKLKECWEQHGLSGNRIIQIIEDRGSILFPSYSVHEWLRFRANRAGFDSFVIVDRMPREDSYPDRLVVVKNLLSNEHVETILQALSQPFWDSHVKKAYLSPVRPRGDECIVS